MTYKEFRKESPIPSFLDMPLSSSMCYIFSPYISKWCIKNKIKPNTVTLMMIISGVLGGLVLMIPLAWCKLVSCFIYYIWFTLDLSDGEVARMTKTFSKGGKYLDWSAHLATHPLCIIGIWITFFQFTEYNMVMISLFCMLLLSLELINRKLVAINDLAFKDLSDVAKGKENLIKKIYLYIISQIAWFPNIVLILPVLFSIQIIFNFNFFLYVFLSWSSLYSLYVIKRFLSFIKLMYKI